jgi:hypothetical protein
VLMLINFISDPTFHSPNKAMFTSKMLPAGILFAYERLSSTRPPIEFEAWQYAQAVTFCFTTRMLFINHICFIEAIISWGPAPLLLASSQWMAAAECKTDPESQPAEYLKLATISSHDGKSNYRLS